MSLIARVTLLALVASCGGAPLPQERRADKKELQARLRAFETPGLIIGEFTLAAHAVVDGDTIKVEGLGNSLRLLGLDAEETFKHENERRAYERGWERYVKEVRGDSKRPVKYATPTGDEAKHWAEDFFADTKVVTLERDHPKEIRDFYERYLAYVIVKKGDKILNYNVECVRAGYSPYFTKYGRSRRFHQEFLAAEAEARAAKRGIWDPSKQHYDDYDERKPWWDARGDFIHRFEEEAQNRENYIILTNWDAMKRLEELVGQEVVILGAIGEVRRADKGPTRVLLSRRRGADFPLIFFDKDVFGSTGIENRTGEYVAVKGFVSRYEDKRRARYVLQIVVNLPGQILGWSGPP